ncbi:MAG TPA: mechanosensitive ion channel domain-containing protein [Stellaceae bacterium]|nr:mechanosensitive ion channel domain-containing protein [Stellaceae bacterium]
MSRLLLALAAALTLLTGAASAHDAAASAGPTATPQMTGWFERIADQLENEASSDVSMAPDVWSAVSREWRSFDHTGSAGWVLVDIAWVALATIAALIVERLVANGASRRPRRRIARRGDGPHLVDLLGLIAADIAGLAAFYGMFVAAHRHVLPAAGVTPLLAMFAANILIRWRVAVLVLRAVLRPADPEARLIEIADDEARRLVRFLSASIFAVIVLVGFGRYGLMDEDSGAPHVVGLVVAILVCLIYVAIVLRTRAAAEALIRGRLSGGVIAAARAGLAEAWVPLALILVATLFVCFVAGLSLGLLAYYHAIVSTLGVLFVVIVLERLAERVWHDSQGLRQGAQGLATRSFHRLLRAIGLAVVALVLASIWSAAIEMSPEAAEVTTHSITAAVVTLFVAFVAWELVRLAIDRHLEGVGGGPTRPGADDDDDAAAPASRLQTILPLVRAAFAVVIGVLAALIVLSRLGVDTAPLIAGAGVFGLAVSFGSQSLVRDIISGLFYMWDDAFRVGEYIDMGRLKGTVETLGIRSVKLRHQNGPLHTIPYGQLGAVTNLSRDFATIKFNLRFDPGTDIELVRKTTKQIGLTMQDENPELAAEVMLPLKLQGVAEVVDNAMVLRFKFTARPVKPSWVQREYLKRIVAVFAEKGIQFASGTTMVLQAPHFAASALPAAGPPASDPAETATATMAGMVAAGEAAGLAAGED